MNPKISNPRGTVLKRAAARAAMLGVAVALAGCGSLDLTNPNSPPEELVLNTPEGIISLANGMQAQYAGTAVGTGMVLNKVRASALVTDEWSTTTLALAADRSLATGTGVDGSFGVVTSPYTTGFRVIRTANLLLQNAPAVFPGPSIGTGIVATAKTFKAMTLGDLILLYPQVPFNNVIGGNPLQPRAAVLDSVIALLESARADMASVTAGQLGDFTTRVQGGGYNLVNVINAMLARYYLLDGDYNAAITAAGRVPLNTVSVFTYPDPIRNPVWGYSFSLNYVRGENTFFTEAETYVVDSAGTPVTRRDLRPSYWLRTDQPTSTGNPSITLRNLRRFQERNESYPIYLPDEMRLIQAEAYTRLGNFGQAATLVNQVRTQQSSTLDEPVAGLPALPAAALDTEAELLTEIVKQRRFELYAQGLRWEDLRRLAPYAGGKTPTIQFLPLPQGECLYNPDVDC
jgi:hypothetical protein